MLSFWEPRLVVPDPVRILIVTLELVALISKFALFVTPLDEEILPVPVSAKTP